MIRDAAALKIARDILQPFIQEQMVDETHVQLAASLIQGAVQIDEKDQEIEATQARIRELGGVPA